MSDDLLDETIATALQALKILIESPRKVHPNGEVTLSLGLDAGSETIFDHYMISAREVISKVPEIAILLELRILEIQRESAYKRLQKLRG